MESKQNTSSVAGMPLVILASQTYRIGGNVILRISQHSADCYTNLHVGRVSLGFFTFDKSDPKSFQNVLDRLIETRREIIQEQKQFDKVAVSPTWAPLASELENNGRRANQAFLSKSALETKWLIEAMSRSMNALNEIKDHTLLTESLLTEWSGVADGTVQLIVSLVKSDAKILSEQYAAFAGPESAETIRKAMEQMSPETLDQIKLERKNNVCEIGPTF